MINSMTGFGRGEHVKDQRKMIVEMKSVNHRYCDVNVRLPRKLNFLENDIKTYTKKRLSRGKIDVYLTYEDNSTKQESIRFNEALTEEYLTYFQHISDRFNLENDIKVSHITRYPDVFVVEEQQDDETLLWGILKEALDSAILKMIETRQVEGELLKKDILIKMTAMIEALNHIEKESPSVVKDYQVKLEARIQELLSNAAVDEARLAVEVALFADRCCIDEEIVRLRSHIEHMEKTLESDQPIGRKLDFLTQEMNREANTILSKANSLLISGHALELKTDIEKIREQIQNIE
ncbi:MAG: YicC family protein [Vallitaleaceae bacterium]|nr:YicC family protein [Vallitaleaceae bacterium]